MPVKITCDGVQTTWYGDDYVKIIQDYGPEALFLQAKSCNERLIVVRRRARPDG